MNNNFIFFFMNILFISISSFATSFNDVHSQLYKLRAFPGQPFLMSCPTGFAYSGATEEKDYKYTLNLTCKSVAKESTLQVLNFNRAGLNLIASIEVAVKPSIGFVCNEAGLKSFLADKSSLFKMTQSSFVKGTNQIKGDSTTVFPQMNVTIFCDESAIDKFIAINVKTDFSDIGTTGEKVSTNVVNLEKTMSFEFPPYFRIWEGTVKERIEKSKAKILDWKPRADKLQGISKILYEDNVALVTDFNYVSGVVDLVNQRKLAAEKSVTAPEFLDALEREFIDSAPCIRNCSQAAKVGPLCTKDRIAGREMAVKKQEEINKDPVKRESYVAEMKAKFEKMKNMSVSEQDALMNELFKTPYTEGCNNEVKEAKDKCPASCPAALAEASHLEVKAQLGWMKSTMDHCLKGGMSSQVNCRFDNFFSSARMYKLGFIESKLKNTEPFLINSDQKLIKQPESIKLFRGSRKVDFVTIGKTLCSACVAESSKYKILALADPYNKKSYDAWTIDEKGKLIHLKDGF